MLTSPDPVLGEKTDNKLTLHFIKRFQGALTAVGFAVEGGKFAPLSFSPRNLKPQHLAGMYLLWTQDTGGNAEYVACTPASPNGRLARTRPRRLGKSVSTRRTGSQTG
jgi:hypothetical protein